ncbi:unnamed protein product [Effrenium voratum]|uniref:Uncharacterized protein n=1 Tax=Effrenium voratum TaxID=2562239 RepID=A0AA36HXM3_9DINO|nr:unnamed protein product [Effrenium voratum]CAJ1376660.1 unnamed protein product [Effrenium voratum]
MDSIDLAVQSVQRLNDEEKVMLVGAVVCITVLLVYAVSGLSSICKGLPAEEDALIQATPVMTVHLHRPGNQKLGICLRANGDGPAIITGISSGDLLDSWNASQAFAEQQVRSGDHILAVTSGGSTCRDGKLMAAKLKEAGDVTLAIGILRSQAEVEKCWQRVTGMTTLPDMVLEEVAELGAPRMSFGGGAMDKVAMEVLKVGPRLAAWNEQCQAKGTCCSQRVEVGDRVVAIGGSTNVRKGLKMPSPTLTLARWHPIGSCSRKSFDAKIERGQDRMGMVICPHPLGNGHAMLLKIAPDGALARWNAGSVCPIHAGDCIVGVNGASTYLNMQKELASPSPSIKIERWEPAGGSSGPSMTAQSMPLPISGKPPAASPSPPQVLSSPELSTGSRLRQPMFWLGLGTLLVLPSFLMEDWQGALHSVAEVARLPKQLPLDSQGTLALLLLGCAWLLLLRFLWCEVMLTGKTVPILPQPVLAFLSSTCFGYGTFFLCNWAGVHS